MKLILCISLLLLTKIDGYIHIPPPWKTALMARYIIHKSDWISIATISTSKSVEGFPFVNLKSMSDGPVSNGTGIPYLYMTELDISGKDLKVDNRCTIMATLAQTDYCKNENYDAQDPRCARLIITGTFVKVTDRKEHAFAQEALYSRHPAMKYWPKEHNFFVGKINIEQIAVLDFFGGIKYVTVEEYFNAGVSKLSRMDFEMGDVKIIQVNVGSL